MPDALATAYVTISPDLSRFAEELRAGVTAAMAGVDVNIPVDADTGLADAKIAATTAAAQGLGSLNPSVFVDVQDAQALAALQALRADSQGLFIDLSDGSALTSIAAVDAGLDALSNKVIDPKVEPDVSLVAPIVDGAVIAALSKARTTAAATSIAGLIASGAAISGGELLASLLAGGDGGAAGGAGGGGLLGALMGGGGGGFSLLPTILGGGGVSLLGGSGLLGMAGFGTLGELMGFGFERIVFSAISLFGSAVEAAIGGAFLGLGALGTMGVGFGTDLAGIGQAAGDIKNVLTPLEQLQSAVGQYGSISSQAVTAQNSLNSALNAFSPAARGAVLYAAEEIPQFVSIFDQLTGPAEKIGAEIIGQAIYIGENFLPTIGKYATENMGIIQKDLQPFFDWLTNSTKFGGLGIFNNLEAVFQKDLPAGMGALTNGFELLGKTVDIASGYLGPFIDKIDSFFTKMNTTDFGTWADFVRSAISQFQAWMGLFVNFGKTIADVFGPSLGLGEDLVNAFSGALHDLDQWLTSSSMVSVLHDLFSSDIVLVIQGIGGVVKGVLPFLEAFAEAFIQIITVGHYLAAAILIPIGDALQALSHIPFLTTIVGWAFALNIAIPAVIAFGAALGALSLTGALATAWGAVTGAVDLLLSTITGAGALITAFWSLITFDAAGGSTATTTATAEVDAALASTVGAGEAAATGLGESFATMSAEAQAVAISIGASMAEVDAALGSTEVAGGAAAGAGKTIGITAIGTDAAEAAGGVGLLSGALSGVAAAAGVLAVVAIPATILGFIAFDNGATDTSNNLQDLINHLESLPKSTLPSLQAALHDTGSAIDTLKGKLSDLTSQENTLSVKTGAATPFESEISGSSLSQLEHQAQNYRGALAQLEPYYHQLSQDQTDYSANTSRLAGVLGISKGNVDALATSLNINLAQAWNPKWIGDLENGLNGAAAAAGTTATAIQNVATAGVNLGYTSTNAALSVQTAFQQATSYVYAFGTAGVSATQIAQNMVQAGNTAASVWSSFSNSAAWQPPSVVGIAAYVQGIQTAQQGLASAESSLSSATGTGVAGAQTAVNTAKTALQDAQQGIPASLNITSGDIAQFFSNQLSQANSFAANVNKALAEGYSPILISQIEQEGPAQGGQYLQALVSDAQQSVKGYNGTLLDIVNSGVASLQKAGEAAVIQAQFTQIAIGAAESKTPGLAAQYATDFADAVAIQTQIVQNGASSLTTSFITGLGLSLPQAQRIANEYGIQLPNSLTANTPAAQTAGSAQANAAASGLANPTAQANAGDSGAAMATHYANGLGDPSASNTVATNASNLASKATGAMNSPQAQTNAKTAGSQLVLAFLNGINNPTQTGPIYGAKNPLENLLTAGGLDFTTIGKTQGANVGTGLAQGLNSSGSQKAVKDSTKAVGDTVNKTLSFALGTSSPSKVAIAQGAFYTQGLAQGLDSATAALNKATAALGKQVTSGLAESLNKDGAVSQAASQTATTLVQGLQTSIDSHLKAINLSSSLGHAVSTLGSDLGAQMASVGTTMAVGLNQSLSAVAVETEITGRAIGTSVSAGILQGFMSGIASWNLAGVLSQTVATLGGSGLDNTTYNQGYALGKTLALGTQTAFIDQYNTLKQKVGTSLDALDTDLKQSVTYIGNVLGGYVASGIESGIANSTGSGTAVSSAVGQLFSNSSTLSTNIHNDGYNLGGNFASGLEAGIAVNQSGVLQAATNVANGAIQAMRTAMGIASPSLKAITVGNDFVDGFIVGMQQRNSAVGAAAGVIARSALSGLQGVSAAAVVPTLRAVGTPIAYGTPTVSSGLPTPGGSVLTTPAVSPSVTHGPIAVNVEVNGANLSNPSATTASMRAVAQEIAEKVSVAVTSQAFADHTQLVGAGQRR